MDINIAILIGRILFGGFFFLMGLSHFAKRKQFEAITIKRNIAHPTFSVITTGIILLFGGGSLLLGAAVAFGIILLIIFLILSSVLIHSFWKDQGDLREMQQIFFMRNLAFIGALLIIYATYVPDWQWALNTVL